MFRDLWRRLLDYWLNHLYVKAERFQLKRKFYYCFTKHFQELYQRELVKTVQAIQEKYDSAADDETGKYLFTILITVISLRHIENTAINIPLLDDLTKTLQLPTTQDLWCKYTKKLLSYLNNTDPKAWLAVTAERCIFETILLESGTTTNKQNLVASLQKKKKRF